MIECDYRLTSLTRRYNSYMAIYKSFYEISARNSLESRKNFPNHEDLVKQSDVSPSAIYIGKRGNRYLGMRAHDNAAKEPDTAVTLFERPMDNLHRIRLLFLILTLLLIVQSCATMERWISPKSIQTQTHAK